ncbi:MAG: hypothetical protein ACR2H1_08230 [Limisphaerales bacterium]
MGCNRKTGPNAELEKAAGILAKTETGGPSPTTVSQPLSPAPTPVQQMNQAMVAYKAGELEDAVARLQKLRTTAVITPRQRMALQDAMAAVMTDIYTRAAKGDRRAMQAVKQHDQMQTRRP